MYVEDNLKAEDAKKGWRRSWILWKLIILTKKKKFTERI